jgi:6,7-dimethyl-8-ribityllumazine synthase
VQGIETLQGKAILPERARFGVVASRFNGPIVEQLLSGCLDTLDRHGVIRDDITVVKVPGAREIPLAGRRLAASGRYDAIIGLGVVIRGATPHFEYVAGVCSEGLAALGQQYDLPVIFGVLTVESAEQALERAGGKSGNRGADAALAAIEMVSLLRRIATSAR